MTVITHEAGNMRQYEAVLPKWWNEVDRYSLLAIFGLFVIGILLSPSASPPLAERLSLNPFHFVTRHVVFGVVGFALILIVSTLKHTTARRMGCMLFAVAFVGLILLPFFGTNFGKGATRWFSLGFGSIQPAEFVKPGLIVLAAWLISGRFERPGHPGVMISFILTGLCLLLLLIQPDFGQSLLVLAGWASIYFAAGAPLIIILMIGGFAVIGSFLAYLNFDYVRLRIDSFIESILSRSDGASHNANPTQVDFAERAIQNGGLFGQGGGYGTQKWYLPDAHTDFIIAVAAEEYGLALVLLIIILYLVIATRSLFRLSRTRDYFLRFAGTGLVIMFSAQAFINLAVSAELFPAKGMTLPMISYGGSSMLAVGITLGLILCFTRKKETEDPR